MCPTQDPAFVVLRLLTSTYRTAHIFAVGADKSLCGQRRGHRAWVVAERREEHIGTLPYACGTCWPIYHQEHDLEMRAIRERWASEEAETGEGV